jgi:RNA polymerase sigma factor (sigma-70 family)
METDGRARQAKEAERVAGLVAAAAAGDEAAWVALVDTFGGLVWSVIRGYRLSAADTADASQTTWLRLAEHIATVREPERIGSWLATTAGRECLRLIRQNRRTVPSDDLILIEAPDPDPAAQPETVVIDLERDTDLWCAFCELPQKAQVLLRLLFADPPPSYEQISLATGMPIGSIGPTRGRYLTQLRTRVEERRLETSEV